MTEQSLPEESIFAQALEISSAAERAAFLDRACGDNPALRGEVEALLRADERSGDLLDLPENLAPENLATTSDLPAREGPGTFLGPYKLLEQIGEGGMGAVWMAEQSQPIQRRVAVKVVKEGMGSHQVLARFEAERQALALMEHPNIAKVLDAGQTPSGRPFFVMELVKGKPITKYCDEKRLAVRERLELFGDVCRAVQHAHQKGIIHRDIKPSNVLVAPYDGKPVVKVIDFGVAKATGQRLTDKTLFTGFGALVGTPEYMSPEQAEVNNQDIDTRSDIYSLGVLLYELLTGSTPLTRKRIKEAALLEVLRVIREEEPPRPSTRLSESKDSLPSISAQRQMEPGKLTKLVRGELDWMVMKALEKDRNRRYETANGFARDVQRYLADEPVLACPPSALYRLRKFARRNKAGLGIAALVIFFLVVLGGGIGWAVRDRAAREHRLAAQVELIQDDVDRLEREQKWPEALAAADRAEAAMAGGEARDASRQRVREVRRGLAFVTQLERIRQDGAIIVEGKYNNRGAVEGYRQAFRDYGVDVESLPAEAAMAALRTRPFLVVPIAAALDDWVVTQRFLREDKSTWKLLVAVARGIDTDPLRDRLRAVWGKPVSPELQTELQQLAESIDVRAQRPATLVTLAWTLRDMQLADLAMQVLRDGHYASPGDFWLNLELGLLLIEEKDYVQAIRYLEAAVAIRPDSAASRVNLGAALYRAKDMNGAIRESRAALLIDPKNALVHVNLATALYGAKDLDGALREYRAALQIDPNLAIAHCNVGVALWDKMDREGALREFRAALQIDPNLDDVHNNLGLILKDSDLEGAIREYQAALKIRPNFASAHNNLGNALHAKNDLDGAIREYQAALTIDPDYADAHNNLGAALGEKGDVDGFIRECRAALQIEPSDATSHYNLGNALFAKNDLEGATHEYRKTLAIDPGFAQAHCNLGQMLRRLGQFRKALEEVRRGHALGSKMPDWPYPSAEWIREIERLLELDAKLSDFLAGSAEPACAGERIELAELCSLKRLHRAAARFYEHAFDADAKLAEDGNASHRYDAACAAALAGCGEGKDSAEINEQERARLRGQASSWLSAELELLTRYLKNGTANAPQVARALQNWLNDADFAGVRGPEALARLHQAERQEWQRLWNDVADMLKRTEQKSAPE
jgi:serine/threonine protein kinase/tetratricopeptide (TPR) repeat protein